MMKIQITLVTAALFSLAGCRTIDEAATADALAVCTEGGYGPGRLGHDYCMANLKPAAAAMERDRRQRQFNDGIAMMARGLNPTPAAKLTCIQQGVVTQCY